MGDAGWLDLEEFRRRRWDRAAGPAALQYSDEFLLSRQHAEPGRYGVLVDRADAPRAGFPLFTTTPQTALFSDPWQLLTADQFRRGDDPPLRDRHAHLVRAVLAAAGADRLGPIAVSRCFDESSVLADPTLPAADRDAAVDAVLRGAQALVEAEGLAAVALPFVAADDGDLRARLRRLGFAGGLITGRSVVELPAGVGSVEDWVATLSKNTRRRYRKERDRFAASGVRIETLPTDDATLRRLAELEVQTLVRHGGHGDVDTLARLRRYFADIWGDKLRLTGAYAGPDLVAGSVDMVGRSDLHGMTYGRDYRRPRIDALYPQLAYWTPVAYCLSAGIRRLRYGFEAFEPKLLRGASLTGLELWIWTPSPAVTTALADLLHFLDTRTRAYLTRWPATLPPP
jgi:Peptidogalycan biosysnthesis/recognition